MWHMLCSIFMTNLIKNTFKKVILHVEESNLGYNRNLPLYYYNTAVWTNLKFLVWDTKRTLFLLFCYLYY